MASKTVAKATGTVRNLKSLALVARPSQGAAPAQPVPGLQRRAQRSSFHLTLPFLL